MAASRELPTEVSHYRILELLGSGGMGEVFLAEDTRLGRRVALKVMPTDSVAGESAAQRFRIEARTASALNHPNIVTIHEIDHSDGLDFIAQEYVSGRTVRDLLANGPLPIVQAVDIAIGVASALQAAHEADVVHRDIKPENIMVRSDGLVKVLDFGLAKLLGGPREDSGEELDRMSTDPGSVMGTFNYMCPEQVLTFEVDPRCDVWSLGVVLHEMITGTAPFSRDTRGDTVKAILFDPPAELSPMVPPELVSIIADALQKERADRTQSASAMLERLTELRATLAPARSGSAGLAGLVQRRSPAGVRRTSSERSVFGVMHLVRTRRPQTILAVVLLVAALTFIWYLSARPRPIESIAIVPFHSDGADSRLAYLSSGLTEEATQRLAQISDLKVMARSTMEKYGDSPRDAIDIGRDLGVDAVVVGTVAFEGDDLRVMVDLIDVRTELELWGSTYRHEVSDLFVMQESISRDISEKLHRKLAGGEQERVARRYASNSGAYDEYLRGRYVWTQSGRRSCDEAMQHFERAVELDPSFALAYVGLADCYNLMGSYGEAPPGEAFPAARQNAERALRLDNSLGSAHIALAYVLQNYEWDWKGAEREYLRAFDLEPSNATGRYWFGGFLMLMGRFEAATEQRALAHSLDPMSIVFRSGQGTPHLLARDYTAAITRYKRAINIDPTFAQAHRSLGWAYLFKGGLEREAVNAFLTAEKLSGTDPNLSPELAYAYAATGDDQRSREILKAIEAAEGVYVPAYDRALVHVALGNHDKALELLDLAVRERSNRVTALKVDPALDPLRDDERFETLLWKTGFHLPE